MFIMTFIDHVRIISKQNDQTQCPLDYMCFELSLFPRWSYYNVMAAYTIESESTTNECQCFVK